MKLEEVIEQLESLKVNQKDFIEKEDLTDVFYRDVIAILEAIIELLNNIINDICYDYPAESNVLTTCYLEIKERILERC